MTASFIPPSAQVIIEVPFHDVDAAQIAWHGHYAKYIEIARCALLDKIDYNYLQMCESGYFWPIVDMKLRYVKPAKFQQKIRVTATVAEWENRLLIKYLIEDAESKYKMTKASTTQVAVCMTSGEMQLASPIVLLEKMGIE